MSSHGTVSGKEQNSTSMTSIDRQRAIDWAIQRGYVNPADTMQIDGPIYAPAPVIRTPPSVFESMLAGTVPCQPVYADNICAAVIDANPQVE